MELSRRLQAVANLVTEGYVLADVGCDHGYIPIYLTERGICPSVIAMDVNEGPLLRAKEHVESQPDSLPITLRLSDGLKALKPGEVQSITIAGMGGGLVMRILSDSADVVKELDECILQPQSEIDKVRAFLIQEGFSFIDEDMVLEDGKYYPMMKVVPNGIQQEAWSLCELRYGKLLLQKKHPILLSYLKREKQLKAQVLTSLSNKTGEHIEKRIQELKSDLDFINQALAFYDAV